VDHAYLCALFFLARLRQHTLSQAREKRLSSP